MGDKVLGTAAKPNLLKKVSLKTVMGGNVKKLFPKRYDADAEDGSYSKGDIIPGQEAPAMRIAGVITGRRTGTTAFGPWVSYKGSFSVINLQTGEISVGSELLVPDLITNVLDPVAVKATEDGAPMEIGFDIGVKSNRAPIGYEFTAVPLMNVAADTSPAMKLLESFGDAPVVPKLAAPSAAQPETNAQPDASSTPAPAAAKKK